jgi:CubicO group peptidase (beta-lactamase class C family)
MKKNIFKPFEMTHTNVYNKSYPEEENRAKGYNMFGQVDDYDILTEGEGGIFSTAEDLFKWDKSGMH